jgi:hypothetical protein
MSTETGGAGGEPRVDPYEFSGEQNLLLLSLGRRMTFVACVILGLAGAAGLASVSGKDPGHLLFGVVNLVVGSLTLRSGLRFQRIARTEGRDLRHLMDALHELRRLYEIQYWVCVAALIGLALLLGSSYAY